MSTGQTNVGTVTSTSGYRTLCNYYNGNINYNNTKTPSGVNFMVVPVFGMSGYNTLSHGASGTGYYTLGVAYKGSDKEQEYAVSRCS